MSNDNKKTPECQSDTSPTFCVYVLWCKITEKYYVGVTRQKYVYTRIRQHKNHSEQFVDREIQRTGWEEAKWDWYILETGVTANLISEREKYWIAFFNSVYPDGYNKTCGGIGNTIISEDTREKMRQAQLGKHHTEETLAKMRTRHPTEEANEKNRQAHLGKKASPETLEKNRQAHIGKHPSAETREKLSESRKGEKNPMYGKPRSPETRAKISATNKGRPSPFKGKHHSAETRAKISATKKARAAAKKAAALAAAENAENQDKTS